MVTRVYMGLLDETSSGSESSEQSRCPWADSSMKGSEYPLLREVKSTTGHPENPQPRVRPANTDPQASRDHRLPVYLHTVSVEIKP